MSTAKHKRYRTIHTVIVLALWVFFSLSLSAQSKHADTPPCKPVAIQDAQPCDFAVRNLYALLGFNHITIATPLEKLTSNGALLTLGYAINPYLSVETRYTKSIKNLTYESQTKTEKIKSNYSNLALFSKISYPVKSFKPYILIGYGKNKITNLSNTTREESSFEYGGGLEYKINPNFSINLEYTRAYGQKGFDGRATQQRVQIELIAASLVYNF